MTFGGQSFGSAPFGAQADVVIPQNPTGMVGVGTAGTITPSITVGITGYAAVASAGLLAQVGQQPLIFNFAGGPPWVVPAFNQANFDFTGNYTPPSYNAANFVFSLGSTYPAYTAPVGNLITFNFGSALSLIVTRRYVTAVLV